MVHHGSEDVERLTREPTHDFFRGRVPIVRSERCDARFGQAHDRSSSEWNVGRVLYHRHSNQLRRAATMTVRFEVQNRCAIITIDRPEVRNAVDGPTAQELAAA